MEGGGREEDDGGTNTSCTYGSRSARVMRVVGRWLAKPMCHRG
jgi:hypothetical protein